MRHLGCFIHANCLPIGTFASTCPVRFPFRQEQLKVVQPLLQLHWTMSLHACGTGGSVESLATRYSRTPLIRPPSESHWCGRIRGMVAREGFVYEQKPLSVTYEDMSPYCSARDEWLIMKLCICISGTMMPTMCQILVLTQ